MLVAACSIAAESSACTAVFRLSRAAFMLAREVVLLASPPAFRIAVIWVCCAEVSDNLSVRKATRRCTLLPPGPSGPCANIAGAEKIQASRSAMAAFFMLQEPPGSFDGLENLAALRLVARSSKGRAARP